MSHLKIVPFSPTDYSLSEVLTLENGTITDSSEMIQKALSLYFQWNAYRSAVISKNSHDAIFTACELDYDRDERQPTQILVHIKSDPPSSFVEFENVKVRFEIFKACYEFTCNILALTKDDQGTPGSKTLLIVSLPTKLIIYKHRRLPRVTMVENSANESLREAIWENEFHSESKVTILEMGIRSIVTTLADGAEVGAGTIHLKPNVSIPANIIRKTANQCIVSLQFNNSTLYGQYFDLYRTIAYPNLKPRSDLDPNSVFALYEKSGYFEKFSKSDFEAARLEIPETWDGVAPSQHESTADYCIVNTEDVPVSAGSVALSFFEPSNEVWFYHQNCTTKDPSHLHLVGAIYLWRTEYLSARPGDIKIGITYDSRSRWMERIYTKYVHQSQGDPKLLPITALRATISADDSDEISDIECKSYKIGRFTRTSTVSDNFWAAVNPKYLNAAEGLDEIINPWSPSDAASIQKISNALAKASGQSSITIRLLIHPDSNVEGITNTVPLVTDRICVLSKADLPDLYSSIEHSLAVTQKKYSNE